MASCGKLSSPGSIARCSSPAAASVPPNRPCSSRFDHTSDAVAVAPRGRPRGPQRLSTASQFFPTVAGYVQKPSSNVPSPSTETRSAHCSRICGATSSGAGHSELPCAATTMLTLRVGSLAPLHAERLTSMNVRRMRRNCLMVESLVMRHVHEDVEVSAVSMAVHRGVGDGVGSAAARAGALGAELEMNVC